MVIRMSKRIVGVAYENGRVIGVTIDRLNDGTDKAYFKRELHGHWIMHDDEFGLTCECSNCHIETMGDGKYCCNCGAKMDVTETDNKPDLSLLFASLEDIIDATD